MKILKYFKRRRIVKKVNKALMIKLHKWQIDFIFDGKPYSEEVRKERCNGKTLAHILRICLKSTNANVQNLQREGENNTKVLHLYTTRRDIDNLRAFADDDCKLTNQRMRVFFYDLHDVYAKLISVETMKGELRDIRFYRIKEVKHLI